MNKVIKNIFSSQELPEQLESYLSKERVEFNVTLEFALEICERICGCKCFTDGVINQPTHFIKNKKNWLYYALSMPKEHDCPYKILK